MTQIEDIKYKRMWYILMSINILVILMTILILFAVFNHQQELDHQYLMMQLNNSKELLGVI
jgi:hypothetical protein